MRSQHMMSMAAWAFAATRATGVGIHGDRDHHDPDARAEPRQRDDGLHRHRLRDHVHANGRVYVYEGGVARGR